MEHTDFRFKLVYWARPYRYRNTATLLTVNQGICLKINVEKTDHSAVRNRNMKIAN